jgi:hypothetical protein
LFFSFRTARTESQRVDELERVLVVSGFVFAAALGTGNGIRSGGASGHGRRQTVGRRRRISQRLKADPTLKKYNIRVSVEGSVATLSGTVPTEADRGQAGDFRQTPDRLQTSDFRLQTSKFTLSE